MHTAAVTAPRGRVRPHGGDHHPFTTGRHNRSTMPWSLPFPPTRSRSVTQAHACTHCGPTKQPPTGSGGLINGRFFGIIGTRHIAELVPIISSAVGVHMAGAFGLILALPSGTPSPRMSSLCGLGNRMVTHVRLGVYVGHAPDLDVPEHFLASRSHWNCWGHSACHLNTDPPLLHSKAPSSQRLLGLRLGETFHPCPGKGKKKRKHWLHHEQSLRSNRTHYVVDGTLMPTSSPPSGDSHAATHTEPNRVTPSLLPTPLHLLLSSHSCLVSC